MINPEKFPPKVLYIDDEKLVREALSTYLVRIGYEVIQAEDGEEGLRQFTAEHPSVVLVDLRMPGIGGLEVLEEVTRESPETPVIIISGAGMLHDAIEALRLGAYDFITKPLQDLAILGHALGKAIERSTLRRENREYREYLEKEVEKQTRALRRELRQKKTAEVNLKASMETLQTMTDGTILAFGRMAEKRDPYTAGHQRRVARSAFLIAREMGMADEVCRGIRVAGVLHDIGKIHIPAEILNKPGALNDIEMSLIRTHPASGYDVLKTVSFPWPVAKVVFQHHERCDGSGYPQGLKLDEIVQEARIIQVADTVEAMSSHRPYRPAVGLEKAVLEIGQGIGTKYYGEAAEACLSLIQENRFSFESDGKDEEQVEKGEEKWTF